jgi:DNA (cytosine-5)-methyltransferase 1
VESAKGQKFREFLNRLRRYGYTVEYRLLKACDYGAPTVRNRLYLIARCDGRPITWPEPTHGTPKSPEVLAGLRMPWRTAAECIDFSLPCPSIFATTQEIWEQYSLRARRPLRDATLRRIFRGLKKYVIDNPEPFIIKNYSGVVGQSADAPLGTVTTIDHHSLVTPYLASYYGDKGGEGFRGRLQREDRPGNVRGVFCRRCLAVRAGRACLKKTKKLAGSV